jgi:hypothetical protein
MSERTGQGPHIWFLGWATKWWITYLWILMSYIWLKAEICGHVGNDSPHHDFFGSWESYVSFNMSRNRNHQFKLVKPTILLFYPKLKHRFCRLKSAGEIHRKIPHFSMVKSTINSPTPEIGESSSHLRGAGRPHVTPVAALAELQTSVTLLRHRFGKNIGCRRCFQSLVPI